MSIAAQLEQNLRARVERNLPNVASRMVDDTRAACSRRTGQLADSIGADPWQDQGTRYVSTIRAAADYAAYQEFGTQAFTIPAGQRPMTFFWDAVGGWRSLRSKQAVPGRHFFFGDDGREMVRRFESALSSEWSA